MSVLVLDDAEWVPAGAEPALAFVAGLLWPLMLAARALPLSIAITFRVARPPGHWGKGRNAGRLVPSAPPFPRGKPDIDELARSTLDSLTGIVFDDDARVAALQLRKVYAAPGQEGARIEVVQLQPEGQGELITDAGGGGKSGAQ